MAGSPRGLPSGATKRRRTATTARPRAGSQARRARRVRDRNRMYGLGLVMLTFVLIAMALGPYADYTAAQDRVHTLVAQRQALDRAVTGLESEAARLQNPAALEEPAREDLGMARPGEIPYIVVNPPTELPTHIDVVGEDDGTVQAPSRLDRIIEMVQSLKF